MTNLVYISTFQWNRMQRCFNFTFTISSLMQIKDLIPQSACVHLKSVVGFIACVGEMNKEFYNMLSSHYATLE